MKQYIKDAMIALAAWPFAVLLWPVLYMIGATKKREMDAKVCNLINDSQTLCDDVKQLEQEYAQTRPQLN